MAADKSTKDANKKLDEIVAQARQASEKRGHGYREKAINMYPWICGRCSREFVRANFQN